jgi:hypothetical protein
MCYTRIGGSRTWRDCRSVAEGSRRAERVKVQEEGSGTNRRVRALGIKAQVFLTQVSVSLLTSP